MSSTLAMQPAQADRYSNPAAAETQTKARQRQQAILHAQADVARRGLPKREIAQRVCSRALDCFDATLVAVARPVGSELIYDIGAGLTSPDAVVVHRDASLTGLCYRSRKSFLSGDVTRDARSSLVATRKFTGRSLMLAVIPGAPLPYGVLMATSDKPDVFDHEDLQALEVLANVIVTAVAAANAVLERQVLVAERAEALSQLDRSEALFRALTENSNELICILREDGTIRYCSPSVAQVLGFEPRELENVNPASLVHGDDRRAMLRSYAAIARNPLEPRYIFVRLRHKDGSWRYLEGAGRNLANEPAVAGIVFNARDVSARVEADRWLEFQAKLLRSVEQAIIATDLEGRLTYWSAGAEKLYGWKSHEVLGKLAIDVFVSPERMARAEEIVEELKTRGRWSGEFEVLCRDGKSVLVTASDTPIRDAAGEMTGFVGISSDITARRELELQLRQAQKMEAVGQLAGGVAHDFNNVLTAIIGYSELALLKLPNGDIHDDITEIRQAGERAADLTKQLLTFSRKQVLRVETVDVGRVIRDLEKMLRRVVNESITVDIEVPDTPVYVEADRSQLEQVVLNLVVNARDAMPEGGRLTVSATVRDTDAGVVAELRVIDSGSGMTDEVKRRIFEPFFTTKGEGRGTGLGLSVVFGVVKQLGGSIRVDSAPGKGTTFSITLRPSTAVPLPRPLATEDLPRGSETVLLVEDNEPLSVMTTRILQGLGYRVVRAINGGIASRLPEATLASVDLVLTDVVMPEMNGPRLVREMKARKLRPAVLYMSGYTQGADLGLETEMRSARFIPKPWSSRELACEVRRALDGRSRVA